MTVIGSASINIRADDKYFEPDVRRAVAKIKDLRIALKVDADMSAANKKLRDLRYRTSKNEVQIKIRANDTQFEADVRAAVRKIKNVQIELKADVDVTKASKKIRDLRYRVTSKDAILKIDANLAKAEEKMRKFLEKFIETDVNITAKAHTGAAHTALSDLQTRYGKNVRFTATADTKVARAALALTARNRHAKITALIDPTSIAALNGMFNTITGTLPFDKIKKSIAGILSNFEGLAVKAATVATALLSVSAATLTLGANLFSVGGDITQVIGIAAMLPAAFIAMGAAIAANKMSWKGFGDALSSDSKKASAAMAELPPFAQEAADSIRGLGREIQKATQVSFWVALETTLQNMVRTLLPELKDGFEYLASSLGSFEAASFNGISDAFDDGVTLGILENIGRMFMNMADGVGVFTQGVATLARVGSTYLPQFGTYLSDAGIKFGNFIQKADEAGKITQWIDTSVRRFKELGSVIGSTSDIMGGLTDIARLSGAPGLTEMAAGFRSIADVVNGEPFRTQLVTILEGARVGTGALGSGLSTLTDLFWKSSDSVGAFLELAGEIAGLTFENITALFDGTGLGSGLFEALMGFKAGMSELSPGFADMGAAVGDLGRIAGELFRSMAPGLNMLAETIRGVVSGLSGGIIDAMPVFNEFAQAVMNLASGPLIALAEGVGSMLTTFSELPGVVQTVLMSLGLLLLLKPKLTTLFAGMATSLAKEDSNIGKTFRSLRTNAIDTAAMLRSDFGKMGTDVGNVVSSTATGVSRNVGLMAGVAGTRLKAMASSAGETFRGLGREVGNALMAAGGMEDVARGFGGLAGQARGAGEAVSSAFHKASVDTGAHFANMADKAKSAGGAVSNAFHKARIDTGAHFANMADGAAARFPGITDKAKSAGGAISNAFYKARIDTGAHFANMADGVKNMSGQMHANLAPARAAFTDLAKHATTTGKTAAAGFGGGIKAAAGGLGAVLGGGWGIALAGATIALGAYAQAQAESKTRVDELSASLEKQGGAWSGTTEKMLATNLLDGATTAWDDLWRGVGKGAQSVEESLSAVGISAADVSEKLSDSSGRDSYLKGWDDINHAMFMGKDVTEEMATAVGLTTEEISKLDSGDLQHLNSQIQKAGEEAERAEERARQLGETFGTNSIESQRLAANYAVLEDVTSSVGDKFSALKKNMDIHSAGAMSAADASKSYHQSLADTATALDEISAREGVVVKGLFDTKTGFDMASQSGRDLHSALSGSADAILMTATSAFDAARTQGKSLEESSAAALVAMDAPLASFKESLKGLGFLPAQIDGIVASFGLVPETVATSLTADGTDAIMEAARTQLTMDAFANGEYAAVLAALPDEAKAALGESMGMAEEFANGEYEAILTALDDTPGGREAALAGLVTFAGEDWETHLTALNLVPEEVAKANAAAQKLMPHKEINLVANDLASQVLSNVNGYDVDGKIIDLTAEDGVSALLNGINSTPMMAKETKLTAQDLVTNIVNDLNATELGGKMSTLQAEDLISATMADINALTLDGKYADLTANDLASMVIMGLNGMTFADKNANITASDWTAAAVGTATAGMTSVPNVTPNIQALNWAGAGTAAAVGTMGAAPHVQRAITAANAAGAGTSGAIGTMASTPNVSRDITAHNRAVDAANAAAKTLLGVNDRQVEIKANDYASGPAGTARAAIDMVKSKTVDIITRFFRRDENANGGVYNGAGEIVMAKGGIIKSASQTATQTFANGGFSGINSQAVKAFAGGGVENHTAQIAKGAWPVRIWAEPETGGEAYIPLSKNKRKRSLDILKMVMAEFGVQGMMNGKAFANGGIMPATQAPAVVSARYSNSVSSSAVTATAGVQSTAAPIVVQVNPSAAMDEEQIGQAAARELYWRILQSQK